MQTIIENTLVRIAQLEKQVADLNKQLRQLHWEDDELSTQIVQANLYAVEKQLIIASFVNCTPHALNIEGLGELRPSGILPRVSKSFEDGLPLHGVRVRKNIYDPAAVVGLPDPVEGLNFVVSGMVMDALNGLPAHMQREDVFAPDTGPDAIRNDKGHIVAVRGLVQ